MICPQENFEKYYTPEIESEGSLSDYMFLYTKVHETSQNALYLYIHACLSSNQLARYTESIFKSYAIACYIRPQSHKVDH